MEGSVPENPTPSPGAFSAVIPSAFRASDDDEPLTLPFFEFFFASGLSDLSAEAIFPWGSLDICAVVEQAHRKRRTMRQQPHFIAGIPLILSWLMYCSGTSPYGF